MKLGNWQVRFAAEDVTFSETLSMVSGQIRHVWAGCGDGNEDTVGMAEEIAATLIGSAFVVCQVKIRRVICALRFDQECAYKFGRRNDRPEDDYIIRGQSKGPDGKVVHSKVDIIWHLANYFKHADEWPRDWKIERKRPEKMEPIEYTISAITVAGLSPKKSYVDNIDQGANFFETDGGTNLVALSSVINDWSESIIKSRYLDLMP
jgi:hypothetical protein